MAIFKNTPPIVTSGLTSYYDAISPTSYTSGSTSWRSIISSSNITVTNFTNPNEYTFVDTRPTAIGFYQTASTINSSRTLFNLPILFSENFSLEIWYKTYTTASGHADQSQSPGIFQIGSYAQNASISIWDWSGALPQGQHQIRTFTNNGAVWSHTTVSATYSDAQWVNKYHQIVLNCSGSSGKWNKCDLYVDTVLVNTINFTTPFPSGSISGGDRVIAPQCNGGAVNNVYATIKTYNRYLTQAEVKQNYDALKTRFNLS